MAPKTDQEMGEALWGKPGAAEKALEKDEKREQLQGKASDDRMASELWPEKSPNLPDIAEGGRVNDLLRDTGGRIKIQGAYGGDIGKLAQGHSDLLENCDVSDQSIGVEIRDASARFSDWRNTEFKPGAGIVASDLRGSDFRSANLKGASLFRSDLRGADFDENTDISACDFGGAVLDGPTYERLRGCTGFLEAKNLHKPIEGMKDA